MAFEIKEFDYAEESLSLMKTASSLDKYEKHWKDFLHYVYLGWEKCELLTKDIGSTQQVRGFVNRCINQDGLIQYLFQARNANQHTIKEIVQKQPGVHRIVAGEGGVKIHGGRIEGSQQEHTLVCEGNFKIEFRPDSLQVVDVKSRNVKYPVPVEHLGAQVSTFVPHELAEMGLAFYKAKLDEIRSALP